MKLLSIYQASQLLNCSRQWVWFLIKMGRLEAKQIGKVYIIKEDDLNIYIDKTNNQTRNVSNES